MVFIQNPTNDETITYDIDNTQENVISFVWGADNLGLRINGIEVYTLDSFTTFTSNILTNVDLRGSSGNYFFGRTRSLNVYSDDEFYNPKFTSFNEMATFAKYTVL